MTHARLSIALDAGKEPPSAFRLFAAGEIDTLKGKFLFDESSAESVMAAWEAWGVDRFAIDYGHSMLDEKPLDPAHAGKAAGWFRLEVRDGELWAVDVEWTPPAAEALRNREWRFVSPAFDFEAVDDRDDLRGRITELINTAITNVPATRNAPPIMAHRRREQTMSQARNSLTAALAASFNEIRRAVEVALKARYPQPAQPGDILVGPWVCELYDDHVVFEWGGKLFSVTYTLNGSAATLTSEPVEVRTTYEPVEGTPMDPTPKPVDGEQTTKLEGTTDEKPQTTEAKPAVPAELRKLLGLADDADEEAVLAAVKAALDTTEEEPIPEAAKAALSREHEKLAKAQRDADEARAELARIKEQQQLARHVERARSLKALPGTKPEALGRDLAKLHATDPELAKRMETVLEAAHTALSASSLLAEQGVGGDGPEPKTAAEIIDERAKALVDEAKKRNEKLSLAKARAVVTEQDPALTARYYAERASK